MTPSRDQLNAFTLTFLSYAVLSGCRAPMSVSKSVMRGSPPFDSDLALGALDSAFLFAYSLGMFATGVLADRARDLAVFLGGAHVLAGLALVALGAGGAAAPAPPFAFFVACSACAGLAQSAGWPACVAVMARRFGRAHRGLVFGAWNANAPVGSVVGKLGSGPVGDEAEAPLSQASSCSRASRSRAAGRPRSPRPASRASRSAR